MRRWLRRIGLALGVVVAIVMGLALYLKGMPWRNHCADAAPAVAAGAAPTNSAVATSQPLATQAAADVLREGGNAVDAAIAAALMLGVVEPGNSGLGGGGFALVHDPKTDKDTALDFRERAPLGIDVAALTAAAKKDANVLKNGALSVAVPSEWSGLVELHRRYGSLPLTRLARPAVEAARAGVVVGRDYAARCWVRHGALDDEAKRIFATSTGLCPLPGWTLHEPDLAQTLEALSKDPASWDDVVGKKMIALLAAQGSSMAAADLAGAVPVERAVVEGKFHGKRIVSLGPPSSGGVIVVELLQTYERMRENHPSADKVHLWVEASRLTFYDRATLFGDPDVVHVPVDHLVAADYATEQAARVAEAADVQVKLPHDATTPREGTHTTHVSVIDKDGLAVAVTVTINVPFGSGLVVPGTGVLLNDEMDDFYVDGPNAFSLLGNALNAPAPGKKPLSSISPAFVFDDDNHLMMVLGSPGGSSIPTAVAWVIKGVVEDGLDGDGAVRAPRIHHQWSPDILQVEPRFKRDTVPAGMKTEKPMFPVGRVQMVLRDKTGWRGVSDCRDDGVPWQGAL